MTGSCFFINKNRNEEEQTNLLYYVLISYLYKDPETIYSGYFCGDLTRISSFQVNKLLAGKTDELKFFSNMLSRKSTTVRCQ